MTAPTAPTASATPASPKKWTKKEDVALFKAIVANTLACRSILYTTPELAPWSSNGGNSINKKIIQHLKKVGNSIPGAGDIVDEHIARMGKGKKTTPTKKRMDEKQITPTITSPAKSTPANSAPTNSTPTKRKRAKVVKEDEDDFDDY